MPNPNAVVSFLIRLDPALDRAPEELLRTERGLTVELEGQRRVRLDPGNPRSAGYAQLLGNLAKQGLPVYLELDPQTAFIFRLLIPHVARVIGLASIDDGQLSVTLELSEARHVLPMAHPDFDVFNERLREALKNHSPVILTEDDSHTIIDVRAFLPGPGRALPSPLELKVQEPLPWPLRWVRDLFNWVWLWPWWPWRCWRCVSIARAQQAFDAMRATTCDPLPVPTPCIPFLYPDDGCWARAHEMCRLMIIMGLAPEKVWIQAGLYVSTRNNPNCHVRWGWHVAPTLCVRGSRFLQTQAMVIDPALFQTPVSKPTWKGVQGDPAASLTDTDDAIYYLWGNVTDPTYAQTNYYLCLLSPPTSEPGIGARLSALCHLPVVS